MQINEDLYGHNTFHTKWLGKQVEYKDVLPSTNDYLIAKAKKGAVEGSLVVADMQTAGKGSKGRQWISPAGGGIWMSFLLYPKMEPAKLCELSVLVSYSIVKFLREQYDMDVQIKWPNDLFINGKKVAGILNECSCSSHFVHYAVIGIGLNVNTKAFPGKLHDIATSLSIEGGQDYSRVEIMDGILSSFEKYYYEYQRQKSLNFLCAEYNQILVHKGKKIRILMGNKESVVDSFGINEFGELMVGTETKKRKFIRMGEISLRRVQDSEW